MPSSVVLPTQSNLQTKAFKRLSENPTIADISGNQTKSLGTFSLNPSYWHGLAQDFDFYGRPRSDITNWLSDLAAGYEGGLSPESSVVPDWFLRGENPDAGVLKSSPWGLRTGEKSFTSGYLNPSDYTYSKGVWTNTKVPAQNTSLASTPTVPQVTMPSNVNPTTPGTVTAPGSNIGLPTWNQAGTQGNLSQDMWDSYTRAATANQGAVMKPPTTGWM